MNRYSLDSFVISLNGVKYHMPICLSDLGEGYSFSDVIDNNKEGIRFLYYENDYTGVEIKVNYTGGFISEKNFDFIQATNTNAEKDDDIEFELNGISMSSTRFEVEEVFGVPDESAIFNDEITYLYYYPDQNITVKFSFMDQKTMLIFIGYGN